MSLPSSSSEIRKCAGELIAALQDLQDATGPAWTSENFRRLDDFARSKSPDLKSYYRISGDRSEFLWDFVASSPEAGIFLAAESEQGISDERSLKHDFEKLLYLYSPLRILITKAKDRQHAEELAKALAAYASECCRVFNPGAVLILHFGLYNGAGNVSYLWQSSGEPKTGAQEKITFASSA